MCRTAPCIPFPSSLTQAVQARSTVILLSSDSSAQRILPIVKSIAVIRQLSAAAPSYCHINSCHQAAQRSAPSYCHINSCHQTAQRSGSFLLSHQLVVIRQLSAVAMSNCHINSCDHTAQRSGFVQSSHQ
ncbi:hypothetical protein PoB_003043100 [Plakobranchus ocellatus]|uniref:Uncharacterized protein n=1 Tax=Plakobranchus ocellatus TaxID=259542 RepID=A0AAV3ZY99_9GAST|nr:hypothetical protein PoB_003043100 [Plakobranchus ocellatus]